jgi:CysZ protein
MEALLPEKGAASCHARPLGGTIPEVTSTLSAITAGLRDLISRRLLGLSIVCFVGALAISVAGAWAALHYLVPLIPASEGPLGWLLHALQWLAGAAIVIVAVSFAPSVSMVLGGLLFDVAAARVEGELGVPAGRPAGILESVWISLRIAIPALVINVVTLPLVFVPVVHVPLFALLNGYLMGREYFTLAALRRMGWQEARTLRGQLWPSVLTVGLVATLIPLVAPLYGASAMTRLLAARRPR